MEQKNQVMWALLVPLSKNWEPKMSGLMFDDGVWDAVVAEAAAAGINTIVLDLLDGLCYGSHPEIALEGAWTRERLRREAGRLKALGIRLIPKLNFSAIHDGWLGQYGRMLGTTTYYHVCRDLIREVAELFDHPQYIHLGMDEEDARHAAACEPAVYRHRELLWHDLQFYFDCVRDTGATPWIWSCPCFDYPEEFRKQIQAGDVVLSPWMYNAIEPAHKTPISSRKAYMDYYSKEPYASMNMQFVEDDPFIVRFMEQALPCVADGYSVVPCVSTVNRCRYNAVDMLQYFKENADPARVLGFITSPWLALVPENRKRILYDIRVFGKAKREIYEGFVPAPGEGAADLDPDDTSEHSAAIY